MKKILAALLATLMLLSFAAACGSSETDSPSAPAPADPAPAPADPAPADPDPADPEPADPPKSDVTITYMASQDWVMDAEIELGRKFTEETGIEIDYQIIPSDQYFNLLLTKLNTGECTDIFGSQGGAFDIISQLDIEKNGIDLSGSDWASRLDPEAAKQVSVGGKVYGQPLQDISAVWAVAYNKKIFADLGLSVPKTFDEFKAVCEAIKNAGITPIYECVADGWHHVLWFPELGCAIEQREPGTADKLNENQMKFEDSASAELLINQIKEMVDLGYWGDHYMSNEFANAAANFASGEYAMFLGNQGFPEEVNGVDPGIAQDDVGMFVMPLLDNQLLNINPVVPTRFVYSGSPNITEAQMYLEFIARPENLQYLIDNVPKYNSLPISGAQSAYTGSIKEFYDAYPVSGTVYQTAVKYVNPQWMEIGKEIENVILGVYDAKTMLRNIDQNRADQADAVGDPAW